jgi:hypothetical protein
MSDNDTTGPGGTLINFPRIGFNLNPTTTLTDPDHTPDDDDSIGMPPPRTPHRPGRLSPLDALNALPDPGLTRPLLPIPVPGPQPGNTPAAFRNQPQPGLTGTPGLGALSMAATLAVAIACLRGTHTVLSTWWENRQARHAETAQLREARLKHQLAMQNIADKGAQQRAKQVPSSSEFGRKSLGGRTGSGGASGGRGGGAGAGRGSAASAAKKNGSLFGGGGSSTSRGGGLSAKHRKNNAAGAGGGRKNGGTGSGGSGSPKPKKPGHFDTPKKSPHRTSQGGSKNLLNKAAKNNPSTGGANTPKKTNGSSSTGLGAALKKDTQKAAARRWKKRQKNGGATPALWGNTPKNAKQKNTPNKPKKGPTQGGNGQHAGGNGQHAGGNGAKNSPNLKKQKHGNGQAQAQGAQANRKNLNQALWHDWKKAAARRWKKRRHQAKAGKVPPIWKAPKKPQAAAAGANTPKAAPNKPKNAGNTPRAKAAGGQAGRKQQRNRQWWAKARAYARKKAAGRTPGATPGQGGPGAGPAGANHPGNGPAAGPAAGAGAGGYVPPRGNQQRRSPFANAGHAAATTYTVTSEHVPGSKAKRWEPSALTTGTPALPSTGPAALNAAPVKTFPRPGSSRPKEPIPMPPATPDRRLAKARHQAARTGQAVTTQARHMDDQHETEITLDDAIDDYDAFADDAFKTHDQCHKLADRAIRLRDILTDFAEELAVKHNLIGALFSSAMARLAESMDLLARMAEEMKTSSLEAAEMAETAANDLNDAYRPYNTATADAGLSTPSAPIHNNV